MKLLHKMAITASMVALFSNTTLSAGTYIVKSGDTLNAIIYSLGFDSMENAGIRSVPSGDINKIYVGDIINYKSKKKRKNRFVKREIDLNKFCFKDNRSIHYRASQRCKGNEKSSIVKKVLGNRSKKRGH